jgi:hypothetical protein
MTNHLLDSQMMPSAIPANAVPVYKKGIVILKGQNLSIEKLQSRNTIKIVSPTWCQGPIAWRSCTK